MPFSRTFSQNMSSSILQRYSRHLLLPEVGMEGQKRLSTAKVLIIGAGGLGSPAALYLAAAGIGTLGIVDGDVVDESNLQRQILHTTATIGKRKTESAMQQISALNPHVSVQCHDTMLNRQNALEILSLYDVVLDGTDTFATRYLVNDACFFLKKPLVYGSVYRFDGQVSSFDAARGTGCYRCLYSAPPPPDLVPNCAEGGVLGVLPGIIGTLQATEVIKILLGIGEVLFGRLLLANPLQMDFTSISFPRNSACPLCGNAPTITELQDYDYEAFCNPISTTEQSYTPHELSLAELETFHQRTENLVVIDVREAHERLLSRIEPSVHIPLSNLAEHVQNLATTSEIVLYCASGKRSAQAASILNSQHFQNIYHLRGGINSYLQSSSVLNLPEK
ncbi:MAG: molybdopterin-synthase adenylyltransferase MoeB [Candidatus Kapaibacterium sp.]|nr:MAG: molybdopterin-synthase adenylyltransferase MoeB [Candidatus Kapabacteria bacterium]